MPNPWEKYAEEEPEGPWSKYTDTAVEELPAVKPIPKPAEKTGILDLGIGEWAARKLGLGPAPKGVEPFLMPTQLPTGGMIGMGTPPVEPGSTMLPFPLPKTPLTAKDIPVLPPTAGAWTSESINQALGFAQFATSPIAAAGLAGGLPALGIAAGLTGDIAGEMPELAAHAGRVSANPAATAEEQAQAFLPPAALIAAPLLPIATRPLARAMSRRVPVKPPAPEVRIPGTPTEVPSDIPSRTFEVEGKSVKVQSTDGKTAKVISDTGEVSEVPVSSLKETTPGTGSARQSELPGLSEEHQALIKEGAQSNAASGLGSKVRLVEEITDTGDPFAKSDNRAIATIDADGNIVVNRPLFQEWTSEIPKWRQKGAVRSLFSEEGFHHIIKQVVSSEAVKELWDNGLTRLERYLEEKSYRGDDKTTPLDSYQLGHEYLRRVAQWADKAGVREVKEASNIPDWLTEEGIDLTLRGIHQARKLLAKAPKLGEIGGIGEKLKTESADTISRMMDRVQSNLESIKANRTYWDARNQDREKPLRALSKEKGSEVDDALDQLSKMRTLPVGESLGMGTRDAYALGYRFKESPERIPELQKMETEATAEKAKAMSDPSLSMEQKMHSVMKSQFVSEALQVAERKTERPHVKRYIDEQEGGERLVAARRKKGDEKDQELLSFLPPIPGEKPERPTAEQAGAYIPEPPSLNKLAEQTVQFVGESAAKGKPSFKSFQKEMVKQYGKQVEPMLESAWKDAVWKLMKEMPAEDLARLNDRLTNMSEKEVEAAAQLRAQRPGVIAEPEATGPKPFGLEGEVGKEARPQVAAEQAAASGSRNRRASMMADVGQRLIQQPVSSESLLDRANISPEDVGWERKRAGSAWREIDETELRNRENLKASLTTGSRVGGEPESVTRRVVAVRDNLTGEVYHLSTYKTGEGAHMIVNPQKVSQRPNTSLDTLLNERIAKGRRRYTPLASILLQDPVQNFRQRFDTEGQWRDQFADESASRSTSYAAGQAETVARMSEGREAPPEGTEPRETEVESPRSTTPPSVRELTEGAGVLRSGRELTRSEVVSLMDYIHEEVQQIESRQDMTDSLGSLKYKADHGKLQAADFRVISALEKMVNHVERTSDLKGDAAVEKVLDTIYDNAKTSKTYDEELVQRTLGEFTPPAPKPVQPVPSPTARELTALSRLPPTVTRGEKLPAGTGPKPELAGEPALQAILKPAGKDLLEWARGMVVKPVQWYSEWMVDRMRRLGGPILKATTDTFNQIISRERELYGSLTPSLDPARTAAGNMGKATTWLHKITPITSRTGVANTVGAIEGTIPVPAFAQHVVGLARTANLQIGNLIAAVVRGFIAIGSFQRNLTAFGFDIVRQGKGRVWDDWTAGLAAANRAPVGAVRSFFRKWKAVLDEPGQDAAILERVNQDFARKFPKVVTHVKTGELGLKWEEVVHANLFNYLETAARRATHARSFREAFPQTATGRQMFRNMQQAARKELAGEYQQDFDALLRTLQGHPTDTYGGNHPLSPGQPLGEIFRFLNQTVGTVMARMVLSGQMFRQPGENIAGSTPVFLGYRNYLRGMARVKQLYPELEKQGAVNRVMYDWSFDPASPVRSASRIVANTFTKGFMENFLNELQEAGAAATARVVRERIDAGTLSGWEKRQLPQTLQAMGFTKAQAASMMVRGREPELLTQFERKAASFLTSGNRAIAEGSRVGANRLFNSLFRFQSYPMMKMNQFRQVTGKMLDAWNTGTTQEKVASTEQFARFAFGNTMQGALTVGTAALAYEGLAGAKIMVNEAKDDPLRFLVESFLSSLSGPLYLLWRGSKSKGLPGISEQAGRAFFPYSITKDMVDAAQGAGQYRDLDGFEKVGKFLSQKIPGTRAIALGMSAVGLSQQNIKLDAAIKGFYRWRRDTMGASESNDWLKDDERREFRKAMKNAVEALKTGKIEAYYEALAQANGTPTATKNSVSSSLKARIILKGPGQGGKPLDLDQLEALRSHIGTEAMDRLQYFDLMLQRAAEGTLIPPME